MDIVLSVLMGISLSAAAGFRIFVPFLVMSLASHFGWMDLGSSSEWIGSLPALIAFAAATIIEIAGYYSPWIDNMLDLIATPLAIVAGSVLASTVIIDMNPLLKLTLSIICGGGAAMNIQLLTVKARALSSVFTTGLGNPIVATVENASSLIVSILAIVVPVLAFLIILIIVYFIYKKIVKKSQLEKTI